MTKLNSRLQKIACSAGRHDFKSSREIGYESWSEKTMTCVHCGEKIKKGWDKGILKSTRVINKGKY